MTIGKHWWSQVKVVAINQASNGQKMHDWEVISMIINHNNVKKMAKCSKVII